MPLPIKLDYDRRVPIYRQIYEAVLGALANEDLQSNEQLPTIHRLASQLGVNPNTVARAYRELERDGHIVSQRGRGTFPADKPSPPGLKLRNTILADIYKRALAEAARHQISARDILRYFRSNIDDSSRE
ncbi:MAG: GntR family transcriptional regulator [Nannocystaceae bacterium]